ncbi:hypothetical protein RFI_08540, partial [Reticulomyxa filosa]
MSYDLIYEKLPNLPISLSGSQCVLFNKEILICGGENSNLCYSYHTLKRQYKLICSYPQGVRLNGHAVLELAKVGRKTTILLSFGGKHKHTLAMKYRSVWNKADTYMNEWTKAKGLTLSNEEMWSVRAALGGQKKELLFIVYKPKNIIVFNIETLKLVTKSTLPIDKIYGGSCFVQTENEMLFFNWNNGLRIKYHEKTNRFKYERLSISPQFIAFDCSYVRVSDAILLFGGYDSHDKITDQIHVYFFKSKKWKQYPYRLPSSICNSFALLSSDSNWVYLIGGQNKSFGNSHFKIKIDDIVQ